MLEHVLTYQTGIYTPEAKLDPNPKNIGLILELFKDKGLIPTTENILDLDSTPPYTPKLQLNAITAKRNWKIAFEKERISCVWNKTEEKDTKTVDQFQEESSEFISSLITKLSIQGTRMYFNMKGILPEKTNEELMKIYNKLFNPLPFFKEHHLSEWSFRNLSHDEIELKSKMEKINVILVLSRIKFHFRNTNDNKPQDRVQIGIDINTLQTEQKQRFGIKEYNLFFIEAKRLYQLIYSQLNEVIN